MIILGWVLVGLLSLSITLGAYNVGKESTVDGVFLNTLLGLGIVIYIVLTLVG